MAIATGPAIETPTVVTAEDVAFFVENGYLVVDDLLRPDETDELCADTLRLARGEYPCDTLVPLPADTTDADALRQILCIHQPHFISPVIERYVAHERVAGVLAQVTGAHLAHWDGSVKCMQSMLFVKPPGFQGQAWHQDEIYIPTRDRSLTGGWIALDDANIDNGCLWVIPGSHKGILYDQRAHDDPEEFDQAAESYGFQDTGEIPVEVKTGDAVFFHGYLLHRSRKNRSQAYRRVLVNHYMNAWSRLPWQQRDNETASRADYRDIVMVCGHDPYAWKGVEERAGVGLRHCKATHEQKQTA